MPRPPSNRPVGRPRGSFKTAIPGRVPHDCDGALWTPALAIPQGDGSYVVKSGRPVDRLSPAQFARAVGLHRNTIYTYIGTDALPERFVEYAGIRKIRIQASAVAHFKKHSRARHVYEVPTPGRTAAEAADRK